MSPVTTIAFDADDTLWQNEHFFRTTEESFAALLSNYAEPDHLAERLLEAERRNLTHYGFGIKGFVLSMIETAIEITDSRVPASVINEILETGREMLQHPVHLLPHAAETVEALSKDFQLLLITKGDLFDQERKIALSGLAELFEAIEIVSEKTANTYRTFFTMHGDGPAQSMMVGNSLRSDILPALEVGSWGIFVPHDLTWSVEHAEEPENHPKFKQIQDLGELPALIKSL